MAEQTNHEDLAIGYLLGSLSEKQELALEEQLISDDGLFEEVEIAEGEVIDRYVRGELSEREGRRVQEMVLNSPRFAERVEIARVFAKKITSSGPQQNDPEPIEPVKPEKKKTPKLPWWNLFGPTTQMAPTMRFVTVAPLALFMLTGVLLVLVWTRYQTGNQRLAKAEQQLSDLQKQIDTQNARSSGLDTALKQTQQEKAAQENLVAELRQEIAEQRSQGSADVFPFALDPNVSSRGEDNTATNIRIPPGKTALELQLNVETGTYHKYVAFLRDINRKPIGQKQTLAPVHAGRRKFIAFKVPVSRIPPGSYTVHVDGLLSSNATEDFSDYQFRLPAR